MFISDDPPPCQLINSLSFDKDRQHFFRVRGKANLFKVRLLIRRNNSFEDTMVFLLDILQFFWGSFMTFTLKIPIFAHLLNKVHCDENLVVMLFDMGFLDDMGS